MISYEPFWSTLKKKNFSKYQLIYHYNISSNTLRRMKNGESINTSTLNQLCLILNCRVQDIVKFNQTEEEATAIKQQREEIKRKKKQKISFLIFLQKLTTNA